MIYLEGKYKNFHPLKNFIVVYCFTISCYFLLYSEVSQPCVYVHPLAGSYCHLRLHRATGRVPCADSLCTVAQSCPTLCNPMEGGFPGFWKFPGHGILEARILEWVAISYSRGSSRPRNQIHVSCIIGRFFTYCATWEA